jgi:hypothetical protein
MTEGRAQPPAADGELLALVEALVDGTATAEGRDRLEGRLRAEPRARQFYVAYLDLHAHLQWRTRGLQGVPGSINAEGEGGTWSVAPRTSPPLVGRFRSWSRLAVAASVVLATGLAVTLLPHRHSSEEAESPSIPDTPAGSVAVLIDNGNTVWEKDMSLPTETASALPPGRLKLKAGVVEVAFRGGGEVLLEGPADFDVSAPDHGFLHRGKLTARVPEGAPAFRVAMPGVVVTDRGGECGLLRDDSGLTEVHVFEGQVGADPVDRPGERGMRLLENAGIRVDAARGTMTPVPLNEQAFARLRPEVRVTDAAVRAGQFAGRNFGTASRLMVKNSILDYTWETYLCFDLSGIKGRVAEARVRLMPVRVGQPFENAAAPVFDNLWGETTLTWERRPPSGPAFVSWTVMEGVPVEFDVTRLVQEALAGDRKLSVRIFAPEFKRYKHFVEYGSRKGEAETRPQLLVTTVP